MSNGLVGLGLLGNLGQGISVAQQAYNPYQHQQQNQVAVTQAMMNAQAQAYYNEARKRFMINGVSMDFDEFVSVVFPHDSQEKTMFLLKFKKED